MTTPWVFLNQRLSIPSRSLCEPGPTDEQVRQLIALASRVPDHGLLEPWRFIRIAGSKRKELGELLAKLHLQRDPEVSSGVLEKDRQRFSHAPLIIAVVAKIKPAHKIPEQEQLLSAGLAAYNLLLGAQAMNFGAQWLTGWAAYDKNVMEQLGLLAHECIVAFVHIGTSSTPGTDRARPNPEALLTDF
jgi:nitroreductase